MIPSNFSRPVGFLVAAVTCATVLPSVGAGAQEPASRTQPPLVQEPASRAASGSPRVSDATVQPAATAPARAVVPPRVSMSHTFTGSVHEEFRLDITFSQSVTGFELADIQATFATAVPTTFEGSGRSYSVTMNTQANYEGTVIINIPSQVANNTGGEGNIGRAHTFNVDNKVPTLTVARVNRDELIMTYSEDLDEDFVPSVNDYSVSYVRGSTFNVSKVTKVEVVAREVFLTLEERVLFGDRVELFYDDRGEDALRDPTGNLVAGEGQLAVVNSTREKDEGEAPGVPTNLTAEADGATVIELAWDAPADTGSSKITGYWIEESDDGGTSWSTLERDTKSTATTYRHTGLDPNTTRHYRVSAINDYDAGDPSNVASATTAGRIPDPPRRLTATASGGSTIELRWTAPFSGAGGPITGYQIEVSPTGTSRWTVLDADTQSRTTSYRHTGLSPGTTRYYRVSAINAAGTGRPSNVANATTEADAPGAPTGLRAVPSGLGGTNQLLLTWTRPSSDGGSAITGYRIETSSNGISGWTAVEANTRSTATTYLHSGLAPGTTRFYRVAAINAVGRGDYASVARGTTNAGRPSQPLALRARADGPRSITLSWNAPASDNGAAVTGYRVRARSPHDNNWITIVSNTNSTATTYTHRNLQPNTNYRYQVAAINSVGAGPWSLEARTTTHPDVPSAPVDLRATPVGTSQINLTWNPPRNNGGAPVLGYRIQASSDGGRTWRIIRSNTGTLATAYIHRGLLPASTWHYRVQAINTAGLGAASNVARATTEATVPGAPRDLAAEADGTSRIDLAWEPPTTDGGASISGYRIEVSDDGGRSWNTLVANTRSARTAYAHTGLAPASTRHYRVSAINRVGTGNASGVASATTDATVPDPPTGLTATAISPTQIDLAWTAPGYDGGAAISGYRIEVSESGTGWTDLNANTGSTATSFSHTGLLPGSRRFYRVSAINRAGVGEASGVASAATDDPVQRAGRLNTMVLPHVAAAMTSSTMGAIGNRIDAVASGMASQRSIEMGSLSSMAASLQAPGAAGAGPGAARGPNAAWLFDGASFALPVGADGAPQTATGAGSVATWGGAEYSRLGEPAATAMEWDGDLYSFHVGADVRVRTDLLAGVAASHSSGSFDFTDKTGANPLDGTYGTTLTSINPYLAWFPDRRGTSVWATGGFGWGEVEVSDERAGLRAAPATMMTGGAGASRQLFTSGTGGVKVKAEGWAGQVVADGTDQIEKAILSLQRGRLALELTQGYRSDSGTEIAVMLEGGARYDNGDGANGAGMEVGGGLRYTSPGLGVTAEGRGRMLVTGREGYEEWGVGGVLTIDPGARGQGLSIRLSPSYGDAASGLNELWERGVSGPRHDRAGSGRTNVGGEVAWGVAGFRGAPFGGFHLAEGGRRAFSSGFKYEVGSGLGLRIEGTRRESALGSPRHTVGVRGRFSFR